MFQIYKFYYVLTRTDRNVQSSSNCSLAEKVYAWEGETPIFPLCKDHYMEDLPWHARAVCCPTSERTTTIHHCTWWCTHPHTGITVCKRFLMRHFTEEGFGHGGFHGLLTSRHWISSSAGYVKDYVYRTSVGGIADLSAMTVERKWCVAKRMLTIHGQNWTASMMWSGPLGVLMLRWIKTCINV